MVSEKEDEEEREEPEQPDENEDDDIVGELEASVKTESGRMSEGDWKGGEGDSGGEMSEPRVGVLQPRR